MVALFHQKQIIMETRVNIEKTQPETWKAMYSLSMVLAKFSITPLQHELIKIRSSQLNGCAFCINMHTQEALKKGETQQRIFLLNAWRETNLYTPEEKAILALTEEVTLISQHGVTEATYQNALQYFSHEVIGQIIIAIVIINAWNRIAVSTQLQVN